MVIGGLFGSCSRTANDSNAEKTFLAGANAVCAAHANEIDPLPNESVGVYRRRQLASKTKQLEEIDRLGPPPTPATAEALGAWRNFLDKVQTASTSTEPPDAALPDTTAPAVTEGPPLSAAPPTTPVTGTTPRHPLDDEGEVAAALVVAGFTDCQPLSIRLTR